MNVILTFLNRHYIFIIQVGYNIEAQLISDIKVSSKLKEIQRGNILNAKKMQIED